MEDLLDIDIVEDKTIEDDISYINKDDVLKGILFSIAYYIISFPLVVRFLERYLPFNVDLLIIQSIMFGIVYYLVSILL